MKKGINKAIVLGYVGQDPESRFMPNGDAVTNISVATSESWKDKTSGELKEITEWHRVTLYRKLAEIVNQYVKKGSKVYVEGRLQTRSWDKDGQKHYATEIIAEEMQMLDSKPQEGRQESRPAESKQHRPAAQQPVDPFDDQSIPF